MAASPRRIAVLFGGPSPEHDVSVLTALLAARALGSAPRTTQVILLYWTRNGSWCTVPPEAEAEAFLEAMPKGAEAVDLLVGAGGGFFQRGRLGARKALEFEAALVCCHGGPGEDGTLQAALDLAGVAYTGPSAAGAALGMDKLAFGALVQSAGLPSLPRLLLTGDAVEPAFAGPFIVKPRFGGSSIGIEVVEDFATAKARLAASTHLRRGAVLEPYRRDLYDVQLALRTYPETALSAIERPLRAGGGEILDYRDKYVAGAGMHAAVRELPAVLAEQLAEQLRSAARQCAQLLGARGVARVDFLTDGEQFFVNEINTIPGSLSRHLFVEPPVAFDVLLDGLVDEAIERPAAAYSTAGADGSILRSAGSIASKLG